MRYIEVNFECCFFHCNEINYFVAPDFYSDEDIEFELYRKLETYLDEMEEKLHEESYSDPDDYWSDWETLHATSCFGWKEVNPFSDKYEDETFVKI